jgi:hypothetical protein
MPAGGRISVSYNEFFPLPGVTLSGISWTPGARTLADETKLKSGTFTQVLPTDPLPYATTSGGMVDSYFDDYYNRIFVIPGALDFGAVVTNTTLNLTIWNAYIKEQVDLVSALFTTGLGLALGGDVVPNLFAPLQSRSYTVTAFPTGPVSIVDLLNLNFAAHQDLAIPLSGTRGKLWSFEPAWPPQGASYQVSYAFQTEIISSRSGREQRIALRSNARKSVSFQSNLTGTGFDRFNQMMWSWQDRIFALPDASRSVTVTADVLVGASIVPVDEIAEWVLPGASLALDGASGEMIVTVDSIDALMIVLRGPVEATVLAGSYVRPVLSGYAASSLQADRQTNRVAVADIRFEVLPLSEATVSAGTPDATFNGREVFLKKPNWANRVTATHAHEVDDLDFGRGPITRFVPIPYGSMTKRGTFLGRNRAGVEALLKLFLRMRGRQGEFYMPTWENDLPLKSPVSAASGAMTVAGPELAEAFGDSTVMRAMFVQLLDGTILLRKVVSVAVVDTGGETDSVVTISGTWGVALSSANVVQAGWMPVWRFASDNLTVEWITNSVANVQMTMQTLEDLTVETP